MPRKATKLFKADLDKMRRRAQKDPDHSETRADGAAPGLYVQGRRGAVTLYYRYLSPVTGTRRRLDIGEYGLITLDSARGEAGELRKLVAAGVDPLEARAEEERAALTLREAVALYLDDLRERAESGTAKRGKRSGYASAKRRLEHNVLPKLGGRKVLDLTSEDVRRLHRGMKGRPAEANRTLTALSAVYGFLDRRELIPAGTNPARYVDRHREPGTRRALTAEELQRLGEALREAEAEGVNPSALLAIRLLALTGMRSGEVLGHGMKDRRGDREGLRWADLDLDRALAHLRDTKTGKQTRVLGAAAVELLRAARPENAEPDHCITPGSVAADRPLVGLAKIRARLWKAAGIEATAEGRADLHSLRHSFASVGVHVAHGRYAGHVSALLGHGYTRRAITERYITGNPEALRPAADAVAGELARLLGLADEPGRVLRHPAAG